MGLDSHLNFKATSEAAKSLGLIPPATCFLAMSTAAEQTFSIPSFCFNFHLSFVKLDISGA